MESEDRQAEAELERKAEAPDQTEDSSPAEKDEVYELNRAVHNVICRCALCQAERQGSLIVASIGPYRFPWFRAPAGWWLLGAVTEFDLEKPNGGMMFRCPKCLGMPQGERPGGSHRNQSPRRPRRRRGRR